LFGETIGIPLNPVCPSYAAPRPSHTKFLTLPRLASVPGHGYSTNPENKFTHREAAHDVFLLLKQLGVDQFSAMGMSSGGMALLHMATSQPERIDSMVLISATSHFPDQARAIMRRASFETMPQPVQNMYRECAKRGDTQIRQLITQFNAFHKDHDDMNFTAQSLSAITARTLIVHGDRDRFFPVEIAVNLYRSIPDAALWIIPGGEHVPILDSTVPFTATALRFLDGPNAPSAKPKAASALPVPDSRHQDRRDPVRRPGDRPRDI
jgi:pimeloyl-ACP methyl ester carboxylesterase